MRHALLLLVPLLAACGDRDGEDVAGRTDTSVQTSDLTGLYEDLEQGAQGGRMCMISGDSGVATFALVTQASDGSCGGAGEAVRNGDRLRLTMTGDGECVLDARIAGTRVTFPAGVPEGCAYYCAPGATLAGKAFDKTGGTREDAMRATDLAGNPLCG